jgi:hypothetical protein
MGQTFDHKDGVTFKDVLLARRYLGEMRATGKLSPELQAAVDQRGGEHIERLAKIIADRDIARGHIEQRAHAFAERVVSILKAKRDLPKAGHEGSVDSGPDSAARRADDASHQ